MTVVSTDAVSLCGFISAFSVEISALYYFRYFLMGIARRAGAATYRDYLTENIIKTADVSINDIYFFESNLFLCIINWLLTLPAAFTILFFVVLDFHRNKLGILVVIFSCSIWLYFHTIQLLYMTRVIYFTKKSIVLYRDFPFKTSITYDLASIKSVKYIPSIKFMFSYLALYIDKGDVVKRVIIHGVDRGLENKIKSALSSSNNNQ